MPGAEARSRDGPQPGSPLSAADWDAAASEAGHAHGSSAPHLASPRKRRERDRHSLVPGALAAGLAAVPRQATALCGRVEARYVAFVGMFFVSAAAASLYSLLAPFFPSVAGAGPSRRPSRRRSAARCRAAGGARRLRRARVIGGRTPRPGRRDAVGGARA